MLYRLQENHWHSQKILQRNLVITQHKRFHPWDEYRMNPPSCPLSSGHSLTFSTWADRCCCHVPVVAIAAAVAVSAVVYYDDDDDDEGEEEEEEGEGEGDDDDDYSDNNNYSKCNNYTI